MTLGLLVNLLPLSTVALVLIAGYGTFYGVLEAGGMAKPAPPGSRWQVPSGWVRGISRRQRFAVWGALLGPGFATRNPYAGFWLLPLAIAAVDNVGYGVLLAALIGAAHSATRASALVRDVRNAEANSYLHSTLRSMYWRTVDGFALLVAAGAAAMTCACRL